MLGKEGVDAAALTVADAVDPERHGPPSLSVVHTVDEGKLPGDDAEPRYRRRSLLGRGGMGEVRLCTDRRIGRDVAMKVALREDAAALQARFLREAQVQGQLEHPAVVPVYDLGRGEGGELFFTMKRIRGVTLEDILRRLAAGDAEAWRRHNQRRLLSAFSSICLALDFAHQHGVLHRDLKPANVMLGDFGEVYLLDWGLAKIADQPDLAPGAVSAAAGPVPPGSSAQTVDGEMMGTLGYMAPEQMRGEWATLDRRADVYSLGAILFEILTLQPLHHGDNARALVFSTQSGAPRLALLEQPPASPVPLDVPPELAALCRSACALEPADRLASARLLHEALERYLDGDRDVKLRREMAERHSQAAAELAQQALSGAGAPATEARRKALREVGLALALDPGSKGSRRTLMELLTQPPREAPPEALRAIERSESADARVAHQTGAYSYLGWLLLFPLVQWMGVREPLVHYLMWGLLLCSGLLSLWASRREHPRPVHAYPILILSTLTMGLSSRMFGPLFMAPAVAAVNTMAFCVLKSHLLRLCTVLLSCLAILVPMVLEMGLMLPPSYVYRHDGLLIRPQLYNLSAEALPFLIIGAVATILTVSSFVTRLQEARRAAERKVQLQAWQLRQLIADE